MVAKEQSIQDSFLEAIKNNQPVSVYLINGIKLQGRITNYDQYCIKLKNGENLEQMIYKNAVSTIVPSRASDSDK